jgi:serine/threonine protein kinase
LCNALLARTVVAGRQSQKLACAVQAHQSTSLTIHIICAGSTSNVFASVDLKTLRLIAMKEFNMHLQELDSNCLLLREVKGLEMQRSPIFSGGSASSPSSGTASSTEASPHIVQFYGAVREGEGVAMAVEYMAGGSLENWIADRHALPEPWLANIAWQVSKRIITASCNACYVLL